MVQLLASRSQWHRFFLDVGTSSLQGPASAAPFFAFALVQPQLSVWPLDQEFWTETGGRVATNLLVRDMDLGVPNAHDSRRLEVVVDGLPLFGGAQFAVDTATCFFQKMCDAAVTALSHLHILNAPNEDPPKPSH